MPAYRGSAGWASKKIGKVIARELFKDKSRKKVPKRPTSRKDPSTGPGCGLLIIIFIIIAFIINSAK